MDATSTVAQAAPVVNWLLLGELCVVVIVACAFLLYHNRLWGTVIAFFLRLYFWRVHHAYITIGSLHVAPLAGRIAFRNLEYHSSNISARILHGNITFRYWKPRVRQEGDSGSSNIKRANLSCRIAVDVDGLECFVYNRTPAYDIIVARMKKHETDINAPGPSSSRSSSEQNPIKARLRKAFRTTHEEEGLSQLNSSNSSNEADLKSNALPKTPKPIELPVPDGISWLREALPVEFKIEKGSVVLGSDATPMVLIMDFKRASGVAEILESRSVCDKYRPSATVQFEEVKVLYRTNVEWSGPLLAHGKKLYDELVRQDPNFTEHPPSSISTQSAFLSLAQKFPFLTDPAFSKPPRAGMPRDRTWHGLARYRADSTKEPVKHEMEYAKVATLLDTKQLDLTYYSDVPGTVPFPGEIDVPEFKDEYGNVDLPPEYGIDVVIHGGQIQYGPWADRQRDALQKTFAPALFFDSEAMPRLRAGEQRVHANLVLNVQFSEETNLHIPTREPSQDWKFDSKPDADLERPYGWLDVVCSEKSSFTYTQSQKATVDGYDSSLILHLDSLSIASSINLQSFVDAKAATVTIAMPSPLRWDAQRNWGLSMSFDTPSFTLLRDHVTLISDLAKDWSSGALGDFHHFVPVHYNFKISLTDYAFHLYINDSNIVDRPHSRDDNAFVDIKGPALSAYVAISSTQYRPEYSVIPFTVNLEDARLELSLPKWDTHKSFQSPEPLEIGRIGKGSATGSYHYYASPHPDHEEKLTLRLDASKVAFKCMGWVLRRLFCVKDNYFGSFTQFTTTQEYLERFDHDPNSVGDSVEEKYRPGRSDPFSVELTLDLQDSLLLLSDEIYACESGLALPIPQFQVMLKSVEAFMELSIDIPPTYFVHAPSIQTSYDACLAPSPSSIESIFIEGIVVKANRLFGPQPRGTTYLCLWEIFIPKVTACLTPMFLSTIRSSITAVAFNYSDKENAPTDIYIPTTPPDVKISLGSASVVMYSGNAGLAVELFEGVTLDTSSLASLTSASSLALLIPSISASLLTRPTARRKWVSAGALRFGVSLDQYKAPKEWQEHAQKQQKFLREEDGPTQRIWHMYAEEEDLAKSKYAGSCHLPRPHATENEDSDDESDDDLENVVNQNDSDSDRPQRPKLDHRRSRSRSFRTAKEYFQESLSDDSGHSSSASSSSSVSLDTLPRDMFTIIADQQRKLHSFHDVKAPDPSVDLSIEPDAKISGVPLANGTLIRIGLEPMTLNLSLASIPVAMTLKDALSQNYSRPSQLLDAALDDLTDQFSDRNARPVPRILDISLPSLRANINTQNSEIGQASRLAFDVGGLRARMSQSVVDGPTPGTTSATVSLVSLRSTLFSTAVERPIVSFRDIGTGLDPSDGHPVLQLDQLGLHVGYDVGPEARQVRVLTDSTDLKIVSSVLGTVKQTAELWQKGLAAATSAETLPPLASLLSAIVQAAGHVVENSPQPAFVSELTYELHVDDDRNIRRDHGWRVLARLRQIMLFSSVDETSTPIERDELISALSRLDWVPDDNNEDLTRSLPFVRKALDLPSTPSMEKSNDTSLTQAAFVSIDNLVIRHYDFLLGTSRVGSTFLRIGTSSVGGQRIRLPGQADTEDSAIIAIGSVDAVIQDSIFPIIRQIQTHIISQSSNPTPPPSSPTKPISKANTSLLVSGHFGSADLSVVAGGLKLRTVISDTTGSMKNVQREQKRNGNSSLMIVKNDANLALEKAEVILWQPSDGDGVPDREVIVAVAMGVKAILNSEESSKRSSVKESRVMLALDSVTFDSRPTLRRALDFAQVWQEKHYPNYEPSLTQMRNSMAQIPTQIPRPPVSPNNMTFDILVHRASFTIRTARSAWIGWQLGRIYACEHGSTRNHSFAIRAAPQSIGFYSSRDLVKKRDTVKLDLPRIKVDGTLQTQHRQKKYHVEVNLGHFDCIVKPSALDKWLSLYKTMVPEIRQLVKDYGSYGRSLLAPATTPSDTAIRAKSPQFRVEVGVERISVGLRADDVPTTLLLQAIALKGQATNGDTSHQALSWTAGVQSFTISLGQVNDNALAHNPEISRKHQSAYMYLNLDVIEKPSDNGGPSELNVSLSQVHTFMHIAALSEISDLISSWTSDLHDLTDQRGTDVAEVRETTSRLLKKMETVDKGDQPEESWFASRLFSVRISSFGIAVPLGSDTIIDTKQSSDTLAPALLFSIATMDFTNRRNEAAQISVEETCLQFVPSFDASMKEHFEGKSHTSNNRTNLPLVRVQAQMSSKSDAWTLTAHCQATDFALRLDPDIIVGVFQLVDLYEQGRDRMDLLEKKYRAELARNGMLFPAEDRHISPVTPRVKQHIYIRLSFTFESGKVWLRPAVQNRQGKPQVKDSNVGHGIGAKEDLLRLPEISVWVDYAGPSTDGLADKDDSAGLAIVNAAIHKSENTVRPSIIPFFAQVAKRVDERVKEKRKKPNQPTPAPERNDATTSASLETAIIPTRVKGAPTVNRIRLTLQLQKSTLRFDCNPDSRAYLDLRWESGGFIASTTIGAEEISTFAGSVSGVSIVLGHEQALGESCIEASGKDLAFSVIHTPRWRDDQAGISVVVDTRISAQFRLPQFSAWLTFKAIWLDSAEIDNSLISAVGEPTSAPIILPPVTTPDRKHIGLAILARFQAIDFDADVTVSHPKLKIHPVVLHTLSNGTRTRVDLQVGKIEVIAEGDISGAISANNFSFQTLRKSTRATEDLDPQLLCLELHTGDFRGSIFLGTTNIARYHLGPSTVTLADDWKDPSRPPLLAFSVQAGRLSLVARILAIPTLLNKVYDVIDAVVAQHYVASQRSAAFKAVKSRKTNEPSPISAALAQTMQRTASHQNEAIPEGCDTVFSQTMKFALAGIDVGVSNDGLEDGDQTDYYYFQVGAIGANLLHMPRKVDGEDSPYRSLSLSVGGFRWVSVKGKEMAAAETREATAEEMLFFAAHKDFFGHPVAHLPSMNLIMNSDEYPGSVRKLLYHFKVDWDAGGGDINFYPKFFETAWRALKELIAGIEKEEAARARRLGRIRPLKQSEEDKKQEKKKKEAEQKKAKDEQKKKAKVKSKGKDKEKEVEEDNKVLPELDELTASLFTNPIHFQPRDPNIEVQPEMPQLKLLGEATGRASSLVPRFTQGVEDLPKLSHRFVVMTLEEGMTLLLRLYAKQLPVKRG